MNWPTREEIEAEEIARYGKKLETMGEYFARMDREDRIARENGTYVDTGYARNH